MKVSDYIVDFFVKKRITDVFGYPGGMVTHLMDSFSKRENDIKSHVCYHEQGASFEACGYAQVSGKMGVAYATSGPGATNMITGICDAYFDSIPVMFITGQVNTFESSAGYNVRQRGFQETNIINMVRDITKYAVYVEDADKIGYYLEKAYCIAMEGRKGPVLLDIPMNIQRADIDVETIQQYSKDNKDYSCKDFHLIENAIKKANRPCIVMGAAVKSIKPDVVLKFVEQMGMPVVTSMIAMDLLPKEHRYNFGYIGAYGTRTANFIVAKSDLVFVLGSRLDVRQVGAKRENFAADAQIIRVDIDGGELEYQVSDNELDICSSVESVISHFAVLKRECVQDYSLWLNVCEEISQKLEGIDDQVYNQFVEKISEVIPEGTVVTTDVGQNQVWVAQSFKVKNNQKVLYSGGHGAMGYSLPAAIGAYYASGKSVVSFNGDGGFQMNIQELEFIKREKLPIKIIIFNNYALGMIRHFQEMYFENNFAQTIDGNGYQSPDFEGIAKAYGLEYYSYESISDVNDDFMMDESPVLVEVKLKEETYVYPKLEFGKPNQDQEPLLDRSLYEELMSL